MQPGGFLGRLVELLLKPGLSLMENVPVPFAKNVLVSSRLTAASSATDEAIYKISFWTWCDNINIFKWRNVWKHENI